MTIAIILDIVLSVGVVGALVGFLGWSILTQDRDHGVIAAGAWSRRRVWSRTGRAHAGPVQPWIVASGRRGEVWPATV
jgi:hypothetical protein